MDRGGGGGTGGWESRRIEGGRGTGGGRGKGEKREKNAKRYFFKFNNALEYFQKQEPKLHLTCI